MSVRAKKYDVVVTGAGIAGLTAALALAKNHQNVVVTEQQHLPCESAFGLQISPNASRLLNELGVLELLTPYACYPEALFLRCAKNLKELSCLPLQSFSCSQWRSAYITLRRSDLHDSLLKAVASRPQVKLLTGHETFRFLETDDGVHLYARNSCNLEEMSGNFLIAADGVHSFVRSCIEKKKEPPFTGKMAWRSTFSAHGKAAALLRSIADIGSITVFLHPRFHLVTYPIAGGKSVNCVVFTNAPFEENNTDPRAFQPDRINPHPAEKLQELLHAISSWESWPVYATSAIRMRISKRTLLVGDAAHAMLPFAAQGAAMAIEDSFTLAEALSSRSCFQSSLRELAQWEKLRYKRVLRVTRHAKKNALIWNASGISSSIRNFFLSFLSSKRLLSRLDWLYGWHRPRRKYP